MKKIIQLGRCFECQRLMPSKWLRQIEYVEGHFAPGEIHHKLICDGCLKKAIELGDVFERDKKPFKEPNIEKYKCI